MEKRHVVVVGGGIAGLAAAHRLSGTGVAVTVIEQHTRIGGKLHTGEVAGVPVETGAESFLFRRPEARELASAVGLADQIVHPAMSRAALAVDGTLRPLPTGTMLGIPADLASVAASGILSSAALQAVGAEPERPGEPLTGDTTVGALVRDRLGTEVLERLVDPLLGGVYAGRADDLSVRATMPVLAAGLASQPSLVRAARAATAVPAGSRPVFASVRGGLSRLVTTVAAASGATVRTGQPLRGLRRVPDGWRLVVGSTRDAVEIAADGVVLAVPATPAKRLLSDVSPAAAAVVGVLDYASIALVSQVWLGGVWLPAGSGALMPAQSNRLVKAVTYLSQKWGTAGPTVVRASVGRYGEEAALQRDDDDLVRGVHSELSTVLGQPLPPPDGALVTRWGGALPQYGAGHLDRVAQARAALAGHPTLALAGAAYDGVGIPACVASGVRAADAVLESLGALGNVR